MFIDYILAINYRVWFRIISLILLIKIFTSSIVFKCDKEILIDVSANSIDPLKRLIVKDIGLSDEQAVVVET